MFSSYHFSLMRTSLNSLFFKQEQNMTKYRSRVFVFFQHFFNKSFYPFVSQRYQFLSYTLQIKFHVIFILAVKKEMMPFLLLAFFLFCVGHFIMAPCFFFSAKKVVERKNAFFIRSFLKSHLRFFLWSRPNTPSFISRFSEIYIKIKFQVQFKKEIMGFRVWRVLVSVYATTIINIYLRSTLMKI